VFIVVKKPGRLRGDRWGIAPDLYRPGDGVEVVLDRLIGRLGPQARLPHPADTGDYPLGEPRSRPKGTDEVAEQSDDPSEKAEKHGGDGASGEVDDGSPTGGDSEQEGEAGAGGDGGPVPTDARAACEEHASSEPGEGLSRGEGGDPGDDPTAPSPGETRAGEAPGAEGEDHTSATEEPEEHSRQDDIPDEVSPEAARSAGKSKGSHCGCGQDRGEAASPSVTPRDEHGGQFASLRRSRAVIARDKSRRRAARRLARRLDQLFAGWTVGGLDESPRIDSRRLVKHLAAKRGGLHRCVRREIDPRHELIILAADVSGSCSAVAEDTVAAIAAVAEHDDRVVLVTHSNGFPHEIQGGPAGRKIARPVEAADTGFDPVTERHAGTMVWWQDLVQRHRIVGAVALGDSDARRVYELLASLAPLVWLDSYAKAAGVKRRKPPIPGVDYITGVGDAATAEEALRQVGSKR
jgi:hypothetical protein